MAVVMDSTNVATELDRISIFIHRVTEYVKQHVSKETNDAVCDRYAHAWLRFIKR